jgi:olfactory receptor
MHHPNIFCHSLYNVVHLSAHKMAYDHFVATCHHLHFSVIMNPHPRMLLFLLPWIINVLHSLLQSLLMVKVSFCTDIEIPCFFCELDLMVKLTCSHNFLSHLAIYISIVLLVCCHLVGILYSYSKIFSPIHAI